MSAMFESVLDRLTSHGFDVGRYRGLRILVTGGAGFIGSWLVQALLDLGAEVFVVDNLWRGNLRNLVPGGGSCRFDTGRRFIEGDLRDYSAALSACTQATPDIVFHLADIVAGIDFVFGNEPFIFRGNMLINSNVFSAVHEARVPNLVYVGTACSFPRQLQQKPGGAPLTEDQTYPADPESAYGWSKLMGEYEAELLGKNSRTSVGILRLHNVYGPRALLAEKRSQVIPSLIRKAVRWPDEEFVVWGSGRQARDFVFVADVVDALLRVPLHGMNEGVLQIGTGRETTIGEVAQAIIAASGKHIPLKFDTSKPEGDGGRSANFSKAQRILGWEPTTKLEDGIRSTYEWAVHEVSEHAGEFAPVNSAVVPS